VPQPTTVTRVPFLKLPVLIYIRNLASSEVRVGEDLSTEAKKIRRELVLYIKDAKKGVHKAFLRKIF
jgi:hypothetical protein